MHQSIIHPLLCLTQADPPLYSRALAYSTPMEHSAVTNMADSQSQMLHNKRNGRYDDDYPTYQEQKKPMIGYPTKSLTQRRPLSARSYSTETYGASQVERLSIQLKHLGCSLGSFLKVLPTFFIEVLGFTLHCMEKTEWKYFNSSLFYQLLGSSSL